MKTLLQPPCPRAATVAPVAAWSCFLCCLPGLAGEPAAPRDLTELSLEDLGRIKVTSVSKKAEPLAHASAAVFVLTGEEIRRSGATSLPEALRLVPGMQVARTIFCKITFKF